MRKYPVALLVLLLAVGLMMVVGCGGEKETTTTVDTPAATSPAPAATSPAPAETAPAPAPTPTTYTDDELGQMFEVAAAGAVDMRSATVADGRANGGERVAIITFVPKGPVGSEGYYQDLGLIWGYVIGAQNEMNADIDSVAVIVGDAAGNAVQTITVGVSDILAWYNGQISDEDFFSRWQVL